jgi:2-phosphosulfolactate phosphatase
MGETVVIDCFPSSVARYVEDHAIVAIDVIRATTMAVTAVASGRRCLVAVDLQDAFATRDRIGDAVLAGEIRGDMPAGFDLNNSPVALSLRTDVHRPLIMLSTSGTELMLEASRSEHGAFVSCLRNTAATARHLARQRTRVALIGAGSRSEFREEDQMGCARVAELLLTAGYRSANARTAEIVKRWSGAPATACGTGNSAGYLRRTGQTQDLEFIIEHVDDLDIVCSIGGNEVRRLPDPIPLAAADG